MAPKKRRSTKKPKQAARRSGGRRAQYERACRLAEEGDTTRARELLEQLSPRQADASLRAQIQNDLAVLDAVEGKFAAARAGFEAALELDNSCRLARDNHQLLGGQRELSASPPPAVLSAPSDGARTRVAILSFLFNWPSTGGGIVHTVELTRFLIRHGYEVKLFFARHAPWGIGRLEEELSIPTEALEFDASAWNAAGIQARFRAVVSDYAPDRVIIMDTWNFKPLLAEAMAEWPYLLRFQALECLCPFNNLRLLPARGGFKQCNSNQLANPKKCRACVTKRQAQSGSLHQAERALSGFGTPEYDARLRRVLQDAAAVLVLNPSIAQLLEDHAAAVHVVPWGMDPDRFPPPEPASKGNGVTRLFLPALVEEGIKGYTVLHEACEQLWQTRQDFELVVTGDPPARHGEFARFIGWQSQAELPQHYRDADICVVPTIAQDGLSRTSVEAMASGLPVVASRIGGLPYTVEEGTSGLLCTPGDAEELAAKLAQLLDDPELRQRLGDAGRRRYEEEFTWDKVIARHYQPLLGAPMSDKPHARAAATIRSRVDNTTAKPAAEVRSATRSLRILFLANFGGEWNNPIQLVDELEELGHKVTNRHEFAVRSADELLGELAGGAYDCLLFSKGRLGARSAEELLQPRGDAIAEVLQRSSVPAYMWYVDRVIGFDPHREAWMRRIAPLCRVAFVTDGQLARCGWARFHLLRQGVFERTVLDVDVPEAQRRDVAFIGSIYGARSDELEPISRHFEIGQVTGVYGPELSRVIRSHRIILGPRFPSAAHYWSDRIYVVLGHGGFLLAPELPGMREEGFVPGEHYAPLGEDSVADVRTWLARPEERARIARAGQARVLERFTYKHRLRTLCGVIEATLDDSNKKDA